MKYNKQLRAFVNKIDEDGGGLVRTQACCRGNTAAGTWHEFHMPAYARGADRILLHLPSLSPKVLQAFVFKGYTIIVDYATYRMKVAVVLLFYGPGANGSLLIVCRTMIFIEKSG